MGHTYFAFAYVFNIDVSGVVKFACKQKVEY